MSQYKYYLKKPRGEIVKDVFTWLAFAGMVTIAMTSPYFVSNLLRTFPRANRYKKHSMENLFYRLKKEGSIAIEKKNNQIYISLTEKGRRKAGRFQINALHIPKQKHWDKKWRIVIFDIPDNHRVKREALRGLLKRLKFYQLQKSVWIHPYDCRDETQLLYTFFGFTRKELRLIIAENIGEDEYLQKMFQLKAA